MENRPYPSNSAAFSLMSDFTCSEFELFSTSESSSPGISLRCKETACRASEFIAPTSVMMFFSSMLESCKLSLSDSAAVLMPLLAAKALNPEESQYLIIIISSSTRSSLRVGSSGTSTLLLLLGGILSGGCISIDEAAPRKLLART